MRKFSRLASRKVRVPLSAQVRSGVLKGLSKVIALLTVFVAMCTVSGCSSPQSSSSQTPISNVSESGKTLEWGQNIKSQALQMINSASSFCYLDMYELSDSDILQALVSAKRRGVSVQIIVDATEKHSQRVAIPTLRDAGVPVSVLDIPGGISHIKMLICGNQVLIGGMNFGAHSWQNNDASVYFPEAGRQFESLFLWDESRAMGVPAEAPVTAPLLLYDRSIQPAVIQAIQSARHSIHVEAFDLSDREVVNALREALMRGVAVKILLDPTEYFSRKPARTLLDAGAVVRYYRPYAGELMHAKILDVDEGRIFLIGSANFSHQAYLKNHEADVELRNMPAFAYSLEENLEEQLGRGTDSATSRKHTTEGGW